MAAPSRPAHDSGTTFRDTNAYGALSKMEYRRSGGERGGYGQLVEPVGLSAPPHFGEEGRQQQRTACARPFPQFAHGRWPRKSASIGFRELAKIGRRRRLGREFNGLQGLRARPARPAIGRSCLDFGLPNACGRRWEHTAPQFVSVQESEVPEQAPVRETIDGRSGGRGAVPTVRSSAKSRQFNAALDNAAQAVLEPESHAHERTCGTGSWIVHGIFRAPTGFG